jgi:hypothetical protein
VIRFTYDSSTIGGRSTSSTTQELSLDLTTGFSALGFLDFGFEWNPLEYITNESHAHGTHTTDTTIGVGDTFLAGKVSLDLPPVAVAPYLIGELVSGARRLEQSFQLEVGLAGTLSFLRELLVLHANVSFDAVSGGHEGLFLRGGVSGVPVAEHDAVLKLTFYVEELALPAFGANQVTVDFSVQLKVFNLFTLAIDLRYQVYEDGLPEGVRDKGTYGARIGIGISYTF